jgi:thermitase
MSTRVPRTPPPDSNRPNPATTPPTPHRFYYANGKKIPLAPSPRFMAVRSRGHSGEEAAAAATAVLTATTPSHPPHVMALPGYDLAIIALESSSAAANITPGQPGPAALNALFQAPETGVSAGPPVYEISDGQDSADAPVLIPVGEVIVKFHASTTREQREQLLKRHQAEVARPEPHVADRMIIRVKNDDDAIDVANALQESELVEYAEPNFATITHELSEPNGSDFADSAGAGSAVLDPDLKPPALRGGPVQVRLDPSTELLEEPEPLTEEELLAPAAAPTDPGFAQQWGLLKIRAPEAWEISPGAPTIKVAVLDEGCDIGHEDIAYHLPGYDALDRDNDPTPAGNDAHGTACAGIVSMIRNNGRGGVGVAPGCRVLPIRIARGIGGGYWYTTTAIVDDAIRTAVARGADVLSNSYSVGVSTAITDAFKLAQTNGRGGKGCCIAAASGNGDVRGIIYPARLSPTIPGFMAVGSSNQWDQRKSKTSLDGETWWGSNYGPELDVVAPGVKIYTADITGPAGYSSGNYTPTFNGTSSATPHVAGLMGLILSVDPNLRGWEVEEIIKMTALDLGPAGRDEQFGFGRIDCRRALEAASRVWRTISITPVFIGIGEECFIRLNLRIYNSGINTVRLSSVTLRSLNPSGTEIDRFEYRPSPGGTMLPRAGHGVNFPRILLRANGRRASWSYRYTINWSYTFWRPSTPGLPLSTMAEPQGAAEEGITRELTGSDAGGEATPALRPGLRGRLGAAPHNGHARAEEPGSPGDSISIDRETRAITIVIR